MKNKNQVPALLSSKNKNFDDLFDRDEKEVNKEQKKVTAKNGKCIQLVSKMSELNVRVSNAEIAYSNSLTNPLVDSVEKYFEIKMLKEEQSVTLDIFTQLFPMEAAKYHKAGINQ